MTKKALLLTSAIFLSSLTPATAAPQKTAKVVTGIFGTFVAPMLEQRAPLEKRGYRVTYTTWYLNDWFPQKTDLAVGHSAGADSILRERTPSRRIITYDPTFVNTGCPKGSTCDNFYNPMNRVPFVFCCGGYQVRGATNKVEKYQHVTLPFYVLNEAMSLIPLPIPKL